MAIILGHTIFAKPEQRNYLNKSSIMFAVDTLVELACTFYMFFKVATNFFNNFLNLLRKLFSVKISLLSSTFIKLFEKIIKCLAAISSREVLQVSISSVPILNAAEMLTILPPFKYKLTSFTM